MRTKLNTWMFQWAVSRFVNSQNNSNWRYCMFGSFLLLRCRVTIEYTGTELYCLGLKRCAIRSKHFNYKIMLDVLEKMAARYAFQGVVVIATDEDNPGLRGALQDRGYKQALYLDKALYKHVRKPL
jgi:hypothetical protein